MVIPALEQRYLDHAFVYSRPAPDIIFAMMEPLSFLSIGPTHENQLADKLF